ncbi:hypothetical protein [Mucilaginibacter aquatilis]|uniref:Uncharacterized protein n=1 Tax=Mucilaginibacter aquatilis TaxID=1517760 RepID=A0A6I4IF64_9SPHI|nr:hypothetical protein [Mucilaginibacter aquatilis]MVN92226.1 hypothetical protein [Mucilaginibacter aquatilis]
MALPSIKQVTKITALITFLGGTLFLLAFYLTMSLSAAILGIVYGELIMLINLAVLTAIIVRAHYHAIPLPTALKAIEILLINVPVSILYLWIGITLSNYVRITFVNPNKAIVENLRVSGCDDKLIQQLNTGQSKTVWIKIPNDCSITINYTIGQQTKQEDVTSYVTNGGGYITTFNINTKQKPCKSDL